MTTPAAPPPLSATPYTEAEIESLRINVASNIARLKAYDGPEPQVGNMTEVSNAMARLLATHTQAQAAQAVLVEALESYKRTVERWKEQTAETFDEFTALVAALRTQLAAAQATEMLREAGMVVAGNTEAHATVWETMIDAASPPEE